MKTKRKVWGLLVAILAAVNVAQGSSSVNGAPGRSDFNKRKNSQASKLPQAITPIVRPMKAPETPLQKETAGGKELTAALPEKQVVETAPAVAKTFVERTAAPTDQNSLSPSNKLQETPIPPVISSEEKAVRPAMNPALAVLPRVPEDGAASPSAVVTEKTKTPVRTISYADVLNDRQKAVLKERAGDLKVAENDYDKLLSADERERLDALVRERMASMASGD